ncbi:MAG: PepSY domain-containing protein [Solirubrobacteraceae bacterium]
MPETPSPAPRWRRRALLAAAVAVSAGIVASGLTLASTGRQPSVPAAVRLTAAAAPSAAAQGVAATPSAAAAERTAVHYVDSHHSGRGSARVLAAEPDVDRGVPVFDVRVLAPNGATYVVHVARSNDAVLYANLAENQAATTPAPTATAPPPSPLAPSRPTTAPQATSPPSVRPTAISPSSSPEASQATEPVETSIHASASKSGTDK